MHVTTARLDPARGVFQPSEYLVHMPVNESVMLIRSDGVPIKPVRLGSCGRPRQGTQVPRPESA